VGDLCAGTLVVAPRLDLWPKALGIVLWLATLAGAGWTVSYICDKDYGVHRIPHLNQVVARLGRTDNSFYVRVANVKLELVRNDNHWTPQNATQATKDANPPPVPSAGD
jgi:hypothetical protein